MCRPDIALSLLFIAGVLLSCQSDKSIGPRENRSPTARIGALRGATEGAIIHFDASSSRDPDGDSLTYTWNFGDGAQASGVVATHLYHNNGSYPVALIVADSHGASDTLETQLNVANAPPVITSFSAPTQALMLGAPATVQVWLADPGDLDSLTATVDWKDGATTTIATSFTTRSGSATHSYQSPGSFTPSVTVTDNDGGATTKPAAHPIVIRSPSTNRAPTASIQGPANGREGGVLMFSARGSGDADGDSLSYTWLPGDGRIFSGPFVGSIEQGWSYPNNGVYTAAVIVTDQLGAADTASTKVTIVNVPPSGVWVSPPSQQAVGIPASARMGFADSGAADTHIVTVRWGDGTSDSVPAADSTPWNNILVHTYRSPGSYRVTATVRDNDGAEGSGTAAYSVTVFDASEHQSIAGYDVFDIGTLGGNSASPIDFNDYAQIVGWSLTASADTNAFVWENGVLRDLGRLGRKASMASRINNAGVILGAVWSGRGDDSYNYRPTIWRNGAGTVLDNPPSGEPTTPSASDESDVTAWTSCGHETCHGWAWNRGWQRVGGLLGEYAETFVQAMNKRGQIVGSSAAVYTGESPYPADHAFLWENGVMRDLGLLSGNPCPQYPDRICGNSSATSINESGQVVGYSTAADGSFHAVLWENATIRDLWTEPAGSTGGSLINDRGQVAGSAGGEGFFWSSGTLRLLGSLGGGGTIVVDINEAGTVVGTSKTTTGERHVFVWTEQGGIVDLGTGPHGFNTAGVVGISFRGDIVGFTAPCTPGDYNHSCDYPTEPRAILWRKQ